MGSVMGAMKSLSGSDTTNVPANILAIIRKRKALAGADSTRKVDVIEDAKLAASGKGKPMPTQAQRDSISQANKPKYLKYVDSIGYEEVKKKQ